MTRSEIMRFILTLILIQSNNFLMRRACHSARSPIKLKIRPLWPIFDPGIFNSYILFLPCANAENTTNDAIANVKLKYWVL